MTGDAFKGIWLAGYYVRKPCFSPSKASIAGFFGMLTESTFAGGTLPDAAV